MAPIPFPSPACRLRRQAGEGKKWANAGLRAEMGAGGDFLKFETDLHYTPALFGATTASGAGASNLDGKVLNATTVSRGRFRWWPTSASATEVAQKLTAHQLHILLSAGNATG